MEEQPSSREIQEWWGPMASGGVILCLRGGQNRSRGCGGEGRGQKGPGGLKQLEDKEDQKGKEGRETQEGGCHTATVTARNRQGAGLLWEGSRRDSGAVT